MASYPGYQRIRLQPYDFLRMFGDPADPPEPKRWLQVNASLAKNSQKSLARFLLEINCYARMVTGRRNPWAIEQLDDDRGTAKETFDIIWPLFGQCIAGLHHKKNVRLLAIDSVGDAEDDTYTVPTSLFSFRQNEWPTSLYFPAVHACPSLVPQNVLDTVLAFQSVAASTLAARRMMLGDKAAEQPEAEDLTTESRVERKSGKNTTRRRIN